MFIARKGREEAMMQKSGSPSRIPVGVGRPIIGVPAGTRTWAVEQVAERLNEAAATLKRLPGERQLGYRSSLPAPARDSRDAWMQAGFDGDPLGLYRKRASVPRPGAPSAGAIDRMFEVLT